MLIVYLIQQPTAHPASMVLFSIVAILLAVLLVYRLNTQIIGIVAAIIVMQHAHNAMAHTIILAFPA